jgi:catechol 2,3-dioxygenase-like lactoylglutathione lyase family enzyme
MTVRRAVPNIRSDDLAATKDFYVELLGFEVAMDEAGFLMFASPTTRTTQITAAAREGAGADLPVRQVDISIEVSDVDAVYADAVRRGLEIVYPLTDEVWGIRRFFVCDPDGTVINVNAHIA